MAENCEHPIIMPLSNPTKLCECDPHDANAWTGGKATFATGSPFPPVTNPDGSSKEIAQSNNALICTCFASPMRVWTDPRVLLQTLVWPSARLCRGRLTSRTR